MTTSEVRPSADDLELLQQLVEWHDSAHLAGHRDAEFLVAFGNDEADVTHPGFAGSKRMSVRTLRRLIRLGALDVLSGDPGPESNAFTFDVVDGVRDRLDELRGIAGLTVVRRLTQVPTRAAKTSRRSAATRASSLVCLDWFSYRSSAVMALASAAAIADGGLARRVP